MMDNYHSDNDVTGIDTCSLSRKEERETTKKRALIATRRVISSNNNNNFHEVGIEIRYHNQKGKVDSLMKGERSKYFDSDLELRFGTAVRFRNRSLSLDSRNCSMIRESSTGLLAGKLMIRARSRDTHVDAHRVNGNSSSILPNAS